MEGVGDGSGSGERLDEIEGLKRRKRSAPSTRSGKEGKLRTGLKMRVENASKLLSASRRKGLK
jgi:hypothetical protein